MLILAFSYHPHEFALWPPYLFMIYKCVPGILCAIDPFGAESITRSRYATFLTLRFNEGHAVNVYCGSMGRKAGDRGE